MNSQILEDKYRSQYRLGMTHTDAEAHGEELRGANEVDVGEPAPFDKVLRYLIAGCHQDAGLNGLGPQRILNDQGLVRFQ